MSQRYDPHDPRERWRWEEEREREDQGLESEGRFARHGGDPRWGTGGLSADPPSPVPVAPAWPASRVSPRRHAPQRAARTWATGLAGTTGATSASTKTSASG